jgi:N-acetylglucosamine-6-phosphate deacetylase
MIAITNCKLFKEGILLNGQTILVVNGKIARIADAGESLAAYQVHDAGGALLTAGFTELQIYGSGGDLFSAYPTAETLVQMSGDLTGKGTTAFLACVATNSPEVMRSAIFAAKEYRASLGSAGAKYASCLGLHLEGPYLNPKRLGAHVPEYVEKATLDSVKELLDLAEGTIRMMTIAAELQDDEVIQYLLDNGVLLSLGHSDASFAQATEAYNKGVKTTTHLFNAMPSIHHRAPNLPTAAFNHPTAMASIIADGMHVDFEVVKMAAKIMKERLFLITDAVTACSTGPYQHRLEGEKFVTADGTLSGSNITLLQAVRNCVEHCGIPLSEAMNMASRYPSNLLSGVREYDAVHAGMPADLLLISDDLVLQKVFLGGVEQ